MRNLAEFFSMLRPQTRESYFYHLKELLHDSENWRFREILGPAPFFFENQCMGHSSTGT